MNFPVSGGVRMSQTSAMGATANGLGSSAQTAADVAAAQASGTSLPWMSHGGLAANAVPQALTNLYNQFLQYESQPHRL